MCRTEQLSRPSPPTFEACFLDRLIEGLTAGNDDAWPSFPEFLRSHVWTADDGGTKLDPWPWQVELAEALDRFRLVIVLKARQLGLSWMMGARSLWQARAARGSLVLNVSQTEPDAIELLAKAQFVQDHLPEAWQPSDARSLTQLLKFPSQHSAIVALPSTQRAGRGRTARLVVADEHAFHQWAQANFAALKPTMDAGGQFLIVSTANGIGNLFYLLWSRATTKRMPLIPTLGPDGYTFGDRFDRLQLGRDEWLPVFLPYYVRPGRDEAWWEAQRESYPQAWMIHQEYPRDPEEAFVQTGRPVFDKAYLDKHKARCRDPIEWAPIASLGDALRVFAAPVHGHRYFAGADVAEGLEHGDYSDLVVFDADGEHGPEEVLSLHGHWSPDVFAGFVDTVARQYRGVYGIERNNHGLAVILECQRRGTPGLYRERAILDTKGVVIEEGRLGWVTSKTTKPLAIDEWEQALRTFGVRLSDAAFHAEHVFYQTLPDGGTSAPSGQNDDRVISRAIGWQMRKHLAQMPQAPAGPRVSTGSIVSARHEV